MLIDEDEILPFLLQIKSTLVDRRALLKICRKQYENNDNELEQIQEFDHLYCSSKALNYFFEQKFLYRLLIKALHRVDIEMLYLLRFFLQDLNEEMKNCSTVCFPVYWAQFMTNEQIDLLKRSTTFRLNSFVIAQLNRDKVLRTLQNSSNTNNLQGVLFQIESNQIGREYNDEILFPLTAHFRVRSIDYQQKIYFVTINVCHMNSSTSKKQRTPLQFVDYLRQLAQFDQAEKLVRLLFKQYPKLNGQLYDALGRIAQDKGLYELSLDYYFKSLENVSARNRANCLNNIGCAFDYLGEYENALQYYSQALTLFKTDLHQSMCLNNIGITYAKNHQHQQAFQCFHRSLSIGERMLSENDFRIGISYTNIAVLQSTIGQFDLAFQHYQQALQNFFLNNCQMFEAIVHQNMGKAFQQQNQLNRALQFYQMAQNKFISVNHPNLFHVQQQIRLLQQQIQNSS